MPVPIRYTPCTVVVSGGAVVSTSDSQLNIHRFNSTWVPLAKKKKKSLYEICFTWMAQRQQEMLYSYTSPWVTGLTGLNLDQWTSR